MYWDSCSISSRFASCRKSYMTMFGILVMHDLTAASQGSSEPEAKWFDLFSSRYRKVVSVGAALFLFQQFAASMEDLEPLRLFQYTIWIFIRCNPEAYRSA
ncbi:plastidic glucose transporter 4-like [Arachis ipaensis]|nr:plastidic glucose transporter 4-like [Arachis ipaensis]XP_016167708.2 plastidic glucose transporter 4-like [Arachis ipaensis]XP_020963301.1 plastidic glucose transporter 4-like [Arachis ipaensis]